MIVRTRSPFDRPFDRTFEQLTSSLFEPRRRLPEVEGSWDGETYVITVDLPGVPAGSVSVDIAGRLLTLGAHTDQLDWSRQVQLGTSLDPDEVTARHLDGRLTVRIPTLEAPQSRTIEITTDLDTSELGTSDGHDAIETASSDAQPSSSTSNEQPAG